MEFILKPLSYIIILGLGVLLRHVGVLKDGDHRVLSALVLKITLPAAIIRAFSQVERDPSLYWIMLLGLMFAFLPLIIICLATRRMRKELRVYAMINTSAYNIGCFALPIIQNFFGPTGTVIACMFDAGNGIISASGSYAITSTLLQTNPGDPPTLKSMAKKFLRSVPFITYIVLITLSIFSIKLPAQVVELVEPIASSNAFLAMLMVGAMFKLEPRQDYLPCALKVVGTRFVFSALFAAICVFLTPFDPMTKRVLAMLCFAPIASLATTYTEQCGGDGALASFTNSLSVVVSLVVMITLAAIPV